jgi:hypothetical protein
MPYRQKRLFLGEIVRQCDYALIGYNDAATAVEKNESRRMWYSLHAMFCAAVHLHQLVGAAAILEGVLGELPAPLENARLALGADWAELARNCHGARSSFDSESAILMLFGEDFELHPLLAAIAQLRQKAEEQMQVLRSIV